MNLSTSTHVPEVNIKNLRARRITQNRALKEALFTKFLKAQQFPNVNNLPENKIHTAKEIISILKSLLYIGKNLNNTKLNTLFTSLRRRINIIEGQLKKRVSNNHRSKNGTNRPHTNRRNAVPR